MYPRNYVQSAKIGFVRVSEKLLIDLYSAQKTRRRHGSKRVRHQLLEHPEIASQWHPFKNGNKTPGCVSANTTTKFWWKCAVDSKHEWQASVAERLTGSNGCPYCAANDRDSSALCGQKSSSRERFVCCSSAVSSPISISSSPSTESPRTSSQVYHCDSPSSFSQSPVSSDLSKETSRTPSLSSLSTCPSPLSPSLSQG